VGKNIKKIMKLITEAWEMSKNMVSFGMRAHSFYEYLQVDLKDEEGFYLTRLYPFVLKLPI
jgi:hypothetical protein